MEELTTETPETESAGDDMDVLPEAADMDTESEDYESDPYENDGEDVATFEDTESAEDEDEESDSAPDEETGSNKTYPEKPDHPDSRSETVSGNSTDYLYGSDSDASAHAAYESDGTNSLLLVETLEKQNNILCAGFMSTLFILGIILGILIMHGFRLRRV